MKVSDAGTPAPGNQHDQRRSNGVLIVNADDWGRDAHTTRCITDCVSRGTVTAVSAMVFMEGSESAAAIARELGLDVGLHLNFTEMFSARSCPSELLEHQRFVAAYLRSHRLAQVVLNPFLASSFDHVVSCQIQEYRRLYGMDPNRFDGHHHMHLCANVLLQKLLPAGTIVRRNFSFQPGEKGIVNRAYRRLVDGILARRHRLADFLFNLTPTAPPGRIRAILALARDNVVELETHPVKEDEYRFLTHVENIQFVGGWRASASV